jgi:hypothetical protein
MHPSRLLISGLPAWVGCSQMVIDGEVVDATGAPVVGANITSAGTMCATVSDSTGKFALECDPGTHTVVVSAGGFTSEEFTQDAPATEHYDSGRHLLVRIPKERGLHLFVDNTYVQMKPGRLQRTLVEKGQTIDRSVCLDTERSEANVVKAGAPLRNPRLQRGQVHRPGAAVSRRVLHR